MDPVWPASAPRVVDWDFDSSAPLIEVSLAGGVSPMWWSALEVVLKADSFPFGVEWDDADLWTLFIRPRAESFPITALYNLFNRTNAQVERISGKVAGLNRELEDWWQEVGVASPGESSAV